jgi:hypothetical protein
MRPLEETPTKPADYAALSAGYGALLGAIALGVHKHPGEGRDAHLHEIPALGLATFALSKLIAKEKVETWVREPFVEETPQGRRPKGRGLRYAVGELLTCSRCVGAWSSLGLVALRVTRPREAKVVTLVLASSALNDFLQTGFTWACERSNRASRAAGE